MHRRIACLPYAPYAEMGVQPVRATHYGTRMGVDARRKSTVHPVDQRCIR
ncbi:hypothetical protein B1400_0859 [Bifidobacterium italicum]|uniref:Uncharacterized protein n=1 Tax=Bifidobacterium italicum TaxID=1960968 RepID=A0A2A2EKC8_9BIFI|nr:hypothetical protein B1400_0859 [Bifidobacterium italicum]